MKKRKLGFSTISIHCKDTASRHKSDDPARAHATPIYQTSTFMFDSAEHGAAVFAGKQEGYSYTRFGNPTQAVLERAMAHLEGGRSAVTFASGMAATTAVVVSVVRSGEKVVASDTLYGGTHLLFKRTLPKMGIEVVDVDASDLRNTERAIDKKTKLVFIETPANPTLKLIDIARTAAIAKKHGVALAVDNTFCTPYYQNPLALGADFAVHSATKYISGHGDTVAGIVVGSGSHMDIVRKDALSDMGASISPFSAWLLLRGLKTLSVRMQKHSENAIEVAKFLSKHPKVKHVWFPWLPSHPQHALAKRQMRGPGGIVSFELKGGRKAGAKMMNAVELCVLAVSLGDVCTLIQHPASMTHASYSREALRRAGISEGLVRISVGIEDADDIIYDLKQALTRA
ncbi:MAG: aminotransferase class I/II-fold pyridoxal phosphate-dependent enzyme [Candidatus Eisenbacteria bacterium]|nr:aminotransferase class I/II-fold pyridoxal phosphate-dependent enzyme [Candidatus Eisenbacteria bacterium]